mmetsp:Transcript_23346/g.55589  ORF Transcript_23346/g.55589 Transcript_23346/m.55589 type:complete len:221 (+) Transcript_23346:646-1308(+)
MAALHCQRTRAWAGAGPDARGGFRLDLAVGYFAAARGGADTARSSEVCYGWSAPRDSLPVDCAPVQRFLVRVFQGGAVALGRAPPRGVATSCGGQGRSCRGEEKARAGEAPGPAAQLHVAVRDGGGALPSSRRDATAARPCFLLRVPGDVRERAPRVPPHDHALCLRRRHRGGGSDDAVRLITQRAAVLLCTRLRAPPGLREDRARVDQPQRAQPPGVRP